jgi:4-hydroxy-tetrahydrodipicolinate synthase
MAQFEPRGVYTALVTPFTEDGSQIDWAAYERLLQAQLDAEVTGVLPCGTTGETPTLSDAEQSELIRRTVAFVRGRVPVLVGTGTNGTKKSIEASLAALEAGADAVMIVMPYYNKPSQAGLLRHVELVAKAVSAPIVLYNIPGRAGVELSVETTLRIVETCPNVVSVKDATGSLFYSQGVLERARRGFAVLSGDDPLTLPMLSIGATGVISVTSNLYPKQVGDVIRAWDAGRAAEARDLNRALYPVHRALFAEPSPQPVKAALALKGRMHATVRPPLVEASSETRELLTRVLRAFEAT